MQGLSLCPQSTHCGHPDRLYVGSVHRHLTDEEREIRSSAGISIRRWWPFAAIYLWPFVTSFDSAMLERCVGRFEDVSGHGPEWVNLALHGSGRDAVLVQTVLAYPCSPFLLRGSLSEFLLFAAMLLPIPFAILNLFWLKRHRAYWDQIRSRDKKRRAEKRARKSGSV